MNRCSRMTAQSTAPALVFALAFLFAAPPAGATDEASSASAPASDDRNLLEKDLTELLQMEVTTASKKQEPWFRTPAAVAVLTSEDIRRSGAETIPDALRLVPGVEVARIDANKWAVSARGSNSRFANKLLVLVDGRSVYTPLFSGVYWDEQDLLLDDVDRIEVIRGPGAALWGSNAVNGVINIITKDSQDTQRVLGRASRGSTEQVYGGLRYGGRIGVNATYRAFVLGFRRDALEGPGVPASERGWEAQRAGFRLDWNPGSADELTMVGHAHSAFAGQFLTAPALTAPYLTTIRDRVALRGADVLGRWVHRTPGLGEILTQGSLNLSDRNEYFGHERRATLDLDAQHRRRWSDSQETVWGANYRFTTDHLDSVHIGQVVPAREQDHLAGVFAQHELQGGDRVSLTLGTKFESSRRGRPSLQPNARLAIHPDEHQTLWAACSRALRTFSRGERTATLRVAVFPDTFSGLPVAATYMPATSGRSESVVAYELGYRLQPTPRLLLDLSGYHNVYDDLRFFNPGTPVPAMDGSTPYLLLPLVQSSAARAIGDGVETAVRFVWSPRWQLRLSHAWAQLEVADAGQAGTSITSAARPPRHSGSLQSLLQLPHRIELDAALQAVGALPGTGVPGYEELSVRLGWQPVPGLHVAVVGENLLHERHLEFPSDVNFAATYVERGVRASLRWLR